jgi:anti-sigma factor RsiW
MSDFKDILNDAEGQDLSEEQLMAWLEGRLSPEERHALEATLGADGMDSDAMEGLHALGAADAKQLQRRLDLELNQNLKRKKRRRREGPPTQRWTSIAIFVILTLAILGFVIIRMRLR